MSPIAVTMVAGEDDNRIPPQILAVYLVQYLSDFCVNLLNQFVVVSPIPSPVFRCITGGGIGIIIETLLISDDVRIIWIPRKIGRKPHPLLTGNHG